MSVGIVGQSCERLASWDEVTRRIGGGIDGWGMCDEWVSWICTSDVATSKAKKKVRRIAPAASG